MANEAMPNTQKPKLSPQERALLFNQSTRKNWQILPSQALVENNSISFDIPKVRLLSRVFLAITGTYKLTHASETAIDVKRFAPWGLVRQVREQINNGFNPYQVSGKGAYLYNSMAPANVLDEITTLGKTASSGGTSNSIDMLLDITNVLNDRDPVGLILTQNSETVVNVAVDFAAVSDLFSTSNTTVSDVVIKVTPIVETFSIPPTSAAIPDLSVLKLVVEQSFNIGASGSTFYVKLPVGQTYRKIVLNFETDAGVAFTDAQIGNISVVLNQADTPIVIPAHVLRKINAKAYGGTGLPSGVLALDFSYQGIANLGGSRDYIDTERLTELWVSVNPGATGNIQAVYETLARLAG